MSAMTVVVDFTDVNFEVNDVGSGDIVESDNHKIAWHKYGAK
jgi:hypothetical protein